jgi:hypothetical protein
MQPPMEMLNGHITTTPHVLFYFCCLHHSLAYLSLADNRLQGSLAQLNWTADKQLVFLNLSGNMLTGPLPSTWSGLRLPISVDVSRNNLTGPLPGLWGSAGADGLTMPLVLLDASNNSLTGERTTWHV